MRQSLDRVLRKQLYNAIDNPDRLADVAMYMDSMAFRLFDEQNYGDITSCRQAVHEWAVRACNAGRKPGWPAVRQRVDRWWEEVGEEK